MLQTVSPGSPGNAAIAGLRDTHFDVLKRAKIGDLVYLTSRNQYLKKALSPVSIAKMPI